ncbi:DUF4365 domain-containing protein [Serratia marcescens]|uniref:DUF4365 domain-containing protein n=1 Tax=Serratia nevei TaxID=2703794 RepID=UPI002938681A|nr:DUF4365 domain-containing protein [Serratia marcescens]ELQ9440310.1 DUF4365 domain-containing protein [Serratia marcescens]ELT5561857.1 DUF4365 domain-containing protein [Serratia marcescens]
MDENIGMSYIEKVANGNAGEFYFAYWVSNNFIWPCRILDIDMGLDAQIEIYDEQYHSTGMFIGVQVKTTAKTLEESPCISVPLKNIVYWESINDPVVIIRVCLNNNSQEPSLYWKHLKKTELKNYLKKAQIKSYETVSISFEENNNFLKKSDKSLWLKLFLRDEDIVIIEHAETIKSKIVFLGQYFEENSDDGRLTAGYPYHNFPSELNDILNEYDKLFNAVKINPRLEYLSNEVSSAINSYNLHINIILRSFTEGVESHSINTSDFDRFSTTNPALHRIINGG